MYFQKSKSSNPWYYRWPEMEFNDSHTVLNYLQNSLLICGYFFCLGLLDLNFELRNRLNKSPGNNIVNPVLRLVKFARKPMVGGPTKNPINAIKVRNAT